MGNSFLLLSHHRSGSNFLCNLLCSNENVVCINEPLSMHTSFFYEKDLIPWTVEEYDDEFLHASLKSYPKLIEYLRELKAYIVEESNGNRALGFKETLLFEKLPWFKKFIPEIKIIYLVRDPRAVVNSVMRNDMYKIWNYDTTVRKYLNKYNLELNVSTPFELAVWSWKIRDGLFHKYKNLFEYRIVKLEDIVNNPEEKANELMSFLNMKLSDSQIEFLSKVYVDDKKGKAFSVFTSKERVLNDWRGKVSNDEEAYIKRILHNEMAEYGYL